MCDSFLTSIVTLVDTLKGKLSRRSYLWSTSKLDFSSSKQEKVNVLVMSTYMDDTRQEGTGINSTGSGLGTRLGTRIICTKAKDPEN